MARTVRLDSLREQVRQRSDTQSLADRFSNAELNEYINQSWAELYNALVQTNQDIYLSSTTITTSSGVDTYSLPSTFYMDRGCDYSNGGTLSVLDRWQFEEREQWAPFASWNSGEPMAYALLGSQIKFVPMPQGLYGITLWYYPAPVRMVADTDTIDGIAGFEEYVVLSAAIKVYQKDDRDPGRLPEFAGNALRMVIGLLSNRSAGHPNHIIRRYAQRGRGFPYPR